MSHPWTNQASYFRLHGNQIPCVRSNSQNLNARAYLNPQSVNYEFIKRTLVKNRFQGGNKIHVNPNFRGNGLSNLSNASFPHTVKAINSQGMLLPKPGTSKTSTVESDSASVGNKTSLNGAVAVPMQSRFKKVNTFNIKTKKSLYSWSKNTCNSYSPNVDSHHKNVPLIDNSNSFLKNSNNFKYNHLNYVSPKQIWQISAENNSEKNKLIYKSTTKIINKSKTKFLNNTSSKTELCFKEQGTPIKRQLNLSKLIYSKNKKSSVAMVAKAVRNKYMYLNNLEQFKKTKYKIDKRSKKEPTVKRKINTKKVNDIRKLFPSYIYNRLKPSPYNVYNVDSYKTVIEGFQKWRKNKLFDTVMQKTISSKFPNRRVVKIGGILYKSTANKLMLADKMESTSKKTVNNMAKEKKNYVVYVRGEKFILENNGKALRRQSRNSTSEKTLLLTPKRIDIGGVTYLQKSKNVLIRTNVHQARYLVNKAKHRSIAMLTNLRKRSSMPCMIYHRFGRCIRHNEGLCMYKHDPKNIAVCKKFLKGDCADKNCVLSHQAVQEKMATCHFFLNSLCVRENCPFLHVKLSKNAAICENFLQGFCKLGKECSKRHFHQCPKFEKTGNCDLGSKCPYPHKKLKKVEKLCGKSDKLKKEKSEAVQYYVHSDTQRKQKKIKRSMLKVKENLNTKVQKKGTKKKALLLNDSDQNNSIVKCFPKRIKLDKLPCFIPLNSDS